MQRQEGVSAQTERPSACILRQRVWTFTDMLAGQTDSKVLLWAVRKMLTALGSQWMILREDEMQTCIIQSQDKR